MLLELLDKMLSAVQGVSPSKNPIQPNSDLYKLQYAYHLGKGLTRKHQPRATRRPYQAVASTVVDDAMYAAWLDFVGHKDNHIQAPLTFFAGAGALSLFDILKELRVNFTYLLHLKTEINNTSAATNLVGVSNRLKLTLEKVIPRKKGFVLVVACTTTDSHGKLISTAKDYWCVKKGDINQFLDTDYLCDKQAYQFLGISKKRPALIYKNDGVGITQVRIKKGAGKHYAKLSGDYNLIHTTDIGAKLFGAKRAFLQGYGLANLSIHELTQIKCRSLTCFSMTFCKPAYESQKLDMRYTQDYFELCDADERLIAFGQFS